MCQRGAWGTPNTPITLGSTAMKSLLHGRTLSSMCCQVCVCRYDFSLHRHQDLRSRFRTDVEVTKTTTVEVFLIICMTLAVAPDHDPLAVSHDLCVTISRDHAWHV